MKRFKQPSKYELDNWELIKKNGINFLRAKNKRVSFLIQLHQSQIVDIRHHFIVVTSFEYDEHLSYYCNNYADFAEFGFLEYMFIKKK